MCLLPQGLSKNHKIEPLWSVGSITGLDSFVHKLFCHGVKYSQDSGVDTWGQDHLMASCSYTRGASSEMVPHYTFCTVSILIFFAQQDIRMARQWPKHNSGHKQMLKETWALYYFLHVLSSLPLFSAQRTSWAGCGFCLFSNPQWIYLRRLDQSPPQHVWTLSIHSLLNHTA